MVDDAHVCLMRNVDVDVVDRLPAFLQYLLCGRDEYTRREAKHLAAVHLDERGRVVERARAAAGEPQVPPAAALGAELEAEEAAAVARPLEHDCSRAVAEEDDG